MDGDEEADLSFDMSEWTVVDEDVSEEENGTLEVESSKSKDKTSPSTFTSVNTNSVSQTPNKPKISSSTATTNKNQSLQKPAKSKICNASSNVTKSAVSSSDNVKIAGKATIAPAVSKSVVAPLTSKSADSKISTTIKSTLSLVTSSSSVSTVTISSKGATGPIVSSVSKPLGTPVSTHITTKPLTPNVNVTSCIPVSTGTTSSKGATGPIVASGSKPLSTPVSTQITTKPLTPNVNVPSCISMSTGTTSSKGATGPIVASASKPLSTPVSSQVATKPAVNVTDQTGLQTASSQTPTKNKLQVKQKVFEVGSIAEVMESVSKNEKDNSGSAMKGISNTEFSGAMDIARYLVSETATVKGAGTKRESSPTKEGPVVKKMKMQNSGTLVEQEQSVNLVKKQNHSGKNEENMVKKVTKKQQPVSSSSTPKGSFGAVKSPAVKLKGQPEVAPSAAKTIPFAATKTNETKNETTSSTATTSTIVPAKRIIRRFHRMTQTVPIVCSNKLLQCLIRVPSIDTPPIPKSHSAVQTVSEIPRSEVYYQRALPETVKPAVFKVVSAFDINYLGERNLIRGCFEYGISLGHVTAADVEKSMFRENLLTKSAHYNLYFDNRDYGVVDLLFSEEEQFLTVITHIRKMKIGPRHLVVTYYKNLKEKERAPGLTVSSIKATIIYNQNFASTNFLTYHKAPVWGKPKVEETWTMHNMPEGIPLDFLKLIIPDAITIDLDDKKQKFTQEGSHVNLGMNHKSGGDRFLKLFAQIYINNECITILSDGTPVADVPDLSDIVNEKKKRKKQVMSDLSVREIKGVSRDIGGQSVVTGKEEIDVIMHVDTVNDVQKILTRPVAAWKGPSSVEKLQQAIGQPKSSNIQIVKNPSKGLVLSDVSEDLSDISDSSNMGEETSNQKKIQKKKALPASKKSAAVPSKTSKPSGKSSTVTKHQRQSRLQEPLAKDDKSIQRQPSDDRQTKRQSERFGKEDSRQPPFKQSSDINTPRKSFGRQERAEDVNISRRSSGRQDRAVDVNTLRSTGRQERAEDMNTTRNSGRQERVEDLNIPRRSIPGSDREKEPFIHRQRVTEGRFHAESESSRDRQQRERFTEKDKYEKFSSNQRDRETHAGEGNRQGHSDSRSEKDRRRSEGRDDDRMRVNPQVDRHGNRILSVWEREESGRKMQGGFVQDMTDNIRYDEGRIDMYKGGDIRRGERLDRLVQKRLGSLERQERESQGMRYKMVARSRSPHARQIHRGSPRRRRSTSPSSARARHPSAGSPPRYLNRFTGMRRSRSPQQRSRNSALSPVSMGDDDISRAPEGIWLSQPPAASSNSSQQSEKRRSQTQAVAGLTHRDGDMWKTSASTRAKTNLVAVQSEWKSTRISLEREQMEGKISRRLVEHRMGVVTGKAPSESEVAGERLSPSQFVPGVHHPSKFFERIREIFGSGVNFTDTGRGVGPSGILKSAGAQSGSKFGEKYVDSKDSPLPSARRSVASVSTNPSSDRRPGESVGQFEGRHNYDVNIRETGDQHRYDSPINNMSQMYGRESVSAGYKESSATSDKQGLGSSRDLGVPNQRGSGGHRDSSVIPNQRGSGGYRDSNMISKQQSSGGYRDSDVPNQQGPVSYRDSGVANQQGPGNYRDSGVPYQQGPGSYRDSGVPNQQDPGGYSDSGVPDQQGPGNYRDSGVPNQQGPGNYRDSGVPYQQGPGNYRDSGIPNQQGPENYRDSGVPNQQGSGGYRDFGVPYQQGSGGYRDSGVIPNQADFGGYHHNHSMSFPPPAPPPPIPPPVAPPLFDSEQLPSQKRISQLEALANSLAADIEKQQSQPSPNVTQGVWNASQQVPIPGPQFPGPQPLPPGPNYMSFSGAQPPQSMSINFPGPQGPIQPTNIHPPHNVTGTNPQPMPWSYNNYY